MALRGLNARELVHRALYGLNAARRVARNVAGGKPLKDALSQERPNLESHRLARKGREAADQALEAASKVYGDVVGWYLGPTDNHCPICVDADGNNFLASNPPSIGKPGSAHPHCRCYAGPPHADGRILN